MPTSKHPYPDTPSPNFANYCKACNLSLSASDPPVSQIDNRCFFDSVYIGTKVFWNKDLGYQPYSSLLRECSTEQPRSSLGAE